MLWKTTLEYLKLKLTLKLCKLHMSVLFAVSSNNPDLNNTEASTCTYRHTITTNCALGSEFYEAKDRERIGLKLMN